MTLRDLAGTLKKASAASGGEFCGPCPWCSGRDRFRVWPEHPRSSTGRFMCRGCGRQGDGLQFVMETEGVSYREACRRLSVAPRPRAATGHAPRWEPKPSLLPGKSWTARAAAFVAHAAAALAAGGPGLDYAASQGLTPETCRKLRVGWNPTDVYEGREAWGLPPEMNPDTGRPRRMWMPAGLVIPSIHDGQVVAVKIRRAGWTPEDRLPKYAALAGSAPVPFVMGQGEGKPVVVVESELDAVLTAQEARDLVCAVALRSARGRPDAEAHALLLAAPVILVATDGDEAGATAWPWWRTNYPQAKRWPVPAGKDVGDLPREMIRPWFEAGIAPSCRASGSAPPPPAAPPRRPAKDVCRRRGCAAAIGSNWCCVGAVVYGDENPNTAKYPNLNDLENFQYGYYNATVR